jgi:hypothetical protein
LAETGIRYDAGFSGAIIVWLLRVTTPAKVTTYA